MGEPKLPQPDTKSRLGHGPDVPRLHEVCVVRKEVSRRDLSPELQSAIGFRQEVRLTFNEIKSPFCLRRQAHHLLLAQRVRDRNLSGVEPFNLQVLQQVEECFDPAVFCFSVERIEICGVVGKTLIYIEDEVSPGS